MPRSDFVRRHEAAFRDFHIFLVGALIYCIGHDTHALVRPIDPCIQAFHYISRKDHDAHTLVCPISPLTVKIMTVMS